MDMFEDFMSDMTGYAEGHAPAPPIETAPAKVNTFSLQPIQNKLEQFKVVIAAMVQEAQGITVHDPDTAKAAVSLGSKAKKKGKEIESARKDIVGPYNDFVSAVNRLAKDCSGPLAQVEMILKKKINEFETRQRLELAKAQEAARKEAARIQAEIDANAAAAGVPAPVVVAPVLPEAPAAIRTEEGSASQRKEWTFEVVDPQEVPREYLLVDERAIRDAVRRGIRQIPGVNIFEHTKTVFRA
jgi:hypothetical protein